MNAADAAGSPVTLKPGETRTSALLCYVAPMTLETVNRHIQDLWNAAFNQGLVIVKVAKHQHNKVKLIFEKANAEKGEPPSEIVSQFMVVFRDKIVR